MGDDNERDAVAEARALLENATGGKWYVHPATWGGGHWSDIVAEVYDYEGLVLAEVANHEYINAHQFRLGDANARLIAAAPDLLRRLADECEALRVALAQRIVTSGTPPVVDVTHYVPLDINVLRGNAAPEPPPRETGADGAGDDSPA